MKKSKKLTKERGSIALFLLVSILFFIIIGYSIYANVANSLSAQEKEIKAIQKNYQENSTEEIMDEKYEELLDGKIRIVFHVQSTGELYQNDKWINQNLIMTIYYPEEVPEDERYFSINGDKKKYEGEYIIEENCTISSEYENIRTKVEVSMIDKILPTVNIEPNGGIYKMPGSGKATIEVKLTTKDEGGSGIDKREYAWSTSETEEPKEGWKEFESGEVIKKTDCMEGTYYLWTKVTDVAGNGVEKKSEEYKVEKLENPIEVANKTVKVGETVDLSTLVSKAQGELSYEIKSQSTQGSSVAGKSLKVGENSATEDNDKTIVIIVTAGGNSNYNEGIKEIVITVQKYTRTLEWENTTPSSIVYGDNSKKATVKVSGTGGTAGVVSYSSSNTKYLTINASTGVLNTVSANGNSTITAKIARTATVKEATITKTISVQRAKIATASAEDKTYNGATQTGVTGSQVTWSGTQSAIDVGTYTAKATPTSNYAWSDGTTEAKTIIWKIEPKSVEVTWGSTTSFVYNGKEQGPTASATSGVSGETINVIRTTGVNVGSYTSTASIASVSGGRGKASNYTLTNTTKAFTITNATITGSVKITGTNKFGSTLTAETSINPADATISYQWYSNTSNSTSGGTPISGATGKTYQVGSGLVGKYIYVVVTAKKTNYANATFSDITDSTNNGSVTVTKISLNKPTATGSYTYNGGNQTLSLNGYNSSTMNISGNTGIDAGNYTATVSLKDSSNYQWTDGSTGNVTLSWKINAKSVEVTWGSTTSFVYNGKEQGPTASATSGVSGETINVTRTTETNVGSYTSTASISSVSGGRGKASNYTLTGNTKQFTINKKAIQKTASNYSGNYDGSSHTIRLVVNEPTSGCTIYYSTSAELTSSNYSSSGSTSKPSRISAGTTTVYWYIHTTNANYSDISGSNTITIKSVAPTISFGSNGGGFYQSAGTYYCSVCKTSSSSPHYHCPDGHSGYTTYSSTCMAMLPNLWTCQGVKGYARIESPGGALCNVCGQPANGKYILQCNNCFRSWGFWYGCNNHGYTYIPGYGKGPCGVQYTDPIPCGKTRVKKSTYSSGSASFSSTISISPNGSNITKRRYGWSTSSSSAPSSWTTFSSNSTTAYKTSYGTSYYLWVEVTYDNGSIARKVSNRFYTY